MSIVTKELETKAANNKWFAAADAERYSRECASRYTSAQRANVLTAVDLIDMVYAYKGIHTNYRKTFIAIKVDAPVVRNRRMLNEVEDILAEKGFEKAVTPQGVVYRIK